MLYPWAGRPASSKAELSVQQVWSLAPECDAGVGVCLHWIRLLTSHSSLNLLMHGMRRLTRFIGVCWPCVWYGAAFKPGSDVLKIISRTMPAEQRVSSALRSACLRLGYFSAWDFQIWQAMLSCGDFRPELYPWTWRNAASGTVPNVQQVWLCDCVSVIDPIISCVLVELLALSPA